MYYLVLWDNKNHLVPKLGKYYLFYIVVTGSIVVELKIVTFSICIRGLIDDSVKFELSIVFVLCVKTFLTVPAA